MTSPKKPDNVVFNAETQKYDASLKPYGTSVGAPIIIPTDTVAWKNRSINKINHKVSAKYLELKSEYENIHKKAYKLLNENLLYLKENPNEKY